MGPLRILRFGLRGGGAADDGVEAAAAPPFDEAFLLETLEPFDDGRTAPFADPPPPPPPPERLNITDLSVLFVPQAVALVWPRFFVKKRVRRKIHQAPSDWQPFAHSFGV
jgi:hypothetical protein